MRTITNKIIEMISVQKSFADFKALDNIDFSVDRGETVVIIGPSGSGKSTLLRTLAKLEDIDRGEIWINNECMAKNKNGAAEYANLNVLNNIRLKFGMVFQNFPLFPHMTILENITTAPTMVLKTQKKQAIKDAKELLKKVGLEKNYAYPHELSGGQKQRAAIARALAMKPEILLFDEPTSALDPELTTEVLKTIKNLVLQEKKTTVIVTHQLSFIEEIADKVVFMGKGKIIEQGLPQQLLYYPKSKRLENFLSHI